MARKRSPSTKRTPKKSRKKLKTSAARRLSAAKKRDVTRQEYNKVIDVLNQREDIIDGFRRELETQFKRMAQIQSELDEVRQAWMKNKN